MQTEVLQTTPQDRLVSNVMTELSQRYQSRHDLEGHPLDRIIAHPAIEAVAHYIVGRSQAERETGSGIQIFNYLENALREDWVVREENKLAGITPDRSRHFLKGTAELFIDTAVIRELEKVLEHLNIKIPLPHVFESFAGQLAEGALMHVFLNRFRDHIADAVVEAETQYNPDGLRQTLYQIAADVLPK